MLIRTETSAVEIRYRDEAGQEQLARVAVDKSGDGVEVTLRAVPEYTGSGQYMHLTLSEAKAFAAGLLLLEV